VANSLQTGRSAGQTADLPYEVVMVRRLRVLCLLAVAVLAPCAASAITVDQVIALAKSGVTDTVILALIDRDRSVFAIEPEQIVSLQRDGLSERVILAMLKSGRAEGDQAARADSAYNSAWIASGLSTEPESISVGHGPDRPNTPHIDGFYSGPPALTFAAPPYYGPSFRYRTQPLASHRSREPRALCYAQISTLRATNQTPFVTECPAVMQPRRK
jgi:hypothetical protein